MTLRIITLAAVVVMIPLDGNAQQPQAKEGWSYSIGAGAIYAPKYMGDDAGRFSIIPNVRVTYEDKFFASVSEGIGYHVLHTPNWKAGPIAKYDFGRDEDGDSTFAVTGDDTDDLIGLGDVDGSVEVGAYVQYSVAPITTKLEIRQGLGGHEGLVGEASLSYGGGAAVYGQRFVYSIGPKIHYTDGRYNESYFGVNASQSVASGLAVYDADDPTLSYGFSANVIVPHTQRVSTVMFANYTQLGNEIADSSLVSERGDDKQASFGVLVNYSF